MIPRILVLALMWSVWGAAQVSAAPPRVVASIAPLSGIAAAVAGDRATVELLLPPSASPHLYQLRPGEARRLARADLVLWVGPQLEGPLARAITSLAGGAELLTALELPGVRLLPLRTPHAHGEEDHEGHGHGERDHEGGEAADHGEGAVDPHLWLDPENAKVIARALADALVRRDPDGAQVYRAALAAFEVRVDALVAELRALLEPVRERPFLVAHDSFQYFERFFGLRGLGALVVSPELPAGARSFAELVERARAAGVVCIFAEPQMDRRLVERVAAEVGARIGELDPVGLGLEPAPDSWSALMRRNAESLVACLAGQDGGSRASTR